MGRIIIDYEDDVDPYTAIDLVSVVIASGRVSEASTGKHYCWATWFKALGLGVYTRKRKKGRTSDSFKVFKRSE